MKERRIERKEKEYRRKERIEKEQRRTEGMRGGQRRGGRRRPSGSHPIVKNFKRKLMT